MDGLLDGLNLMRRGGGEMRGGGGIDGDWRGVAFLFGFVLGVVGSWLGDNARFDRTRIVLG